MGRKYPILGLDSMGLRAYFSLSRLNNVRLIHWWVASVCFAFAGYGFLTTGINKVVDIPLIRYYIGVYPESLLAMGVFLIALDYKFGRLALPLFVMTLGAFDFLELIFWTLPFAFRHWITPYFQVELMIGGWLLARRPTFVINRYFVVFFIAWAASGGYGDLALNYIYELALFLYVVKGTVPRTDISAQRHPPQSPQAPTVFQQE